MLGLIFVIILSSLIILILGYLLLSKFLYEKERLCHRKNVYKVLHHYAEEYDHYLLNDVQLYLDENNLKPMTFDHILFADKYIYVISDYAEYGGIYGKAADELLFLKKENGQTIHIPNPLHIGLEKMKTIEYASHASPDKHIFVSMVVYNNSLIVHNDLKIKNGTSCFLPLKELASTLNEAEKDHVTAFDDNRVKSLVLQIKERSDRVKEDVKKNQKLLKKQKQQPTKGYR